MFEEIPDQLRSWRVDQVIEALSFRKVFGWNSEERKQVEKELLKVSKSKVSHPYEREVYLPEVWDYLSGEVKEYIVKAYNSDKYSYEEPIKMENVEKLVREELSKVLGEEKTGFDPEKMLKLGEKNKRIEKEIKKRAENQRRPHENVLKFVFERFVLENGELNRKYQKI